MHLVEPRVAGNTDLPPEEVKDSLEPFRKVGGSGVCRSIWTDWPGVAAGLDGL